MPDQDGMHRTTYICLNLLYEKYDHNSDRDHCNNVWSAMYALRGHVQMRGLVRETLL